MKFFSVDGPLFKFFDRLWDIIKLNFFWLLCSLPVVTFGASTIAAFSITMHMAEDTEGYIVKPFFREFKANLKKGIPMGLMFLAALYAIFLYVQIIFKATQYEGLLLALGIVFVVVYVQLFLYAFALAARYDNGVFKTLINSYHICMKFNMRSLGLAAIVAVEICLFLWNEVLMIVGLLIAPGCVMLTISAFALRIFKSLEKEPGAVSNPEDLDKINNPEKQDEENKHVY